MKRVHKLIRNVLIILSLVLITFYCNYYFKGYHMSKDDSIQDYFNFLGEKDSEFITELNLGEDATYPLYFNSKTKKVYVLRTEKRLLFYRTFPYHIDYVDEQESGIDYMGQWEKEKGQFVLLYRNDKNISYIKVQFINNNEKYILKEWKENFTWLLLDNDDWNKGIYSCYDQDDNLIEEIEW